MQAIPVLRFVTIYLTALVTGTLFVTPLAWILVVDGLAPATAVPLHQQWDPLVDRWQPPFVATALVSGIILLVLWRHTSRPATLFTALGVAGMAGLIGYIVAAFAR